MERGERTESAERGRFQPTGSGWIWTLGLHPLKTGVLVHVDLGAPGIEYATRPASLQWLRRPETQRPRTVPGRRWRGRSLSDWATGHEVGIVFAMQRTIIGASRIGQAFMVAVFSSRLATLPHKRTSALGPISRVTQSVRTACPH